MELTNKEFVELLDKMLYLEPGEEEKLLNESYQRFKDSDYDEEDEELWNDEGGEW